MKTAFALSALLLLTTSRFVAAATAMLPHCLGMATDEKTMVEYCISSDGEKSEKKKTVELQIVSGADIKGTVASTTRKISLRTGQSKTVGETADLLRAVFQKFLANPAAASVLDKLGSLEKGGEVEFVAVTPEVLRLDFKAASGVRSTELSQADVANFLALLTK